MNFNVSKDYIYALRQRVDLVRVFGLMDKKDDFATRKFIEEIEKLKKLIKPCLLSKQAIKKGGFPCFRFYCL